MLFLLVPYRYSLFFHFFQIRVRNKYFQIRTGIQQKVPVSDPTRTGFINDSAYYGILGTTAPTGILVLPIWISQRWKILNLNLVRYFLIVDVQINIGPEGGRSKKWTQSKEKRPNNNFSTPHTAYM